MWYLVSQVGTPIDMRYDPKKNLAPGSDKPLDSGTTPANGETPANELSGVLGDEAVTLASQPHEHVIASSEAE